MTGTTNEDKNTSPIIEIVEWLNDDDELISSFTKDLSLSQHNVDKALPSSTDELQSLLQKSHNSDNLETKNTTNCQVNGYTQTKVTNATKPSSIIKMEDESSSSKASTKVKAVKKVQFQDGSNKPSNTAEESHIPPQPARVLRFRQRLNGFEPTLNRFSNTTKEVSSLISLENSGDNRTEGASDIDHDFETVLLDLKHEQANKLKLNYKTKIYLNDAKDNVLQFQSESIVIENPDLDYSGYAEDEIDDLNEIEPDAPLYFLSDDLDQMVRDYDCGLFDDNSKQNVVEKLEDFEQLNAILEATQLKLEHDESNPELKGVLEDDKTSFLNSIVGKNNSEPSDFDVMANDIIENEVADDAYDDEMGFFDYDDVEKNVLDQDIKLNYFRLKRKLYPSRAQDEEIEQL